MSIRHIRLAQQDKDRLIRLKTKTGIKQWNILCRWALALSLREADPPIPQEIPADSNVEMTWEVFAGDSPEIWLALLRERAKQDKLPTDPGAMQKQFRLHLHRGIGYLSTPGYIGDIGDLCGIVVT